MANGNSGLWMIAIVAIVAVVGMITMFSGGSSTVPVSQTDYSSLVSLPSENLAGQAYHRDCEYYNLDVVLMCEYAADDLLEAGVPELRVLRLCSEAIQRMVDVCFNENDENVR